MSQRELMDALRQEGEARVDALWQKAREEAETLRKKRDALLEELRAEAGRERRERAEGTRRSLLSRATVTARTRLLQAEERLSERLLILARQGLPTLKRRGDPKTFAALVAELPPAPWARVTLHPDDLERGAASFPEAQLFADPEVSGGIDVETDRGEIRVINTLDKRLERAWPQLLPALMKEIRRALENPGTPEND